ncbi:hypothetical protein K438DRAFT_1810709 [Mycena galopus ATCC 62051]|nr:hypothetical protein K438DRAFT_1810709 [Mycena galopus ATCC 62051]
MLVLRQLKYLLRTLSLSFVVASSMCTIWMSISGRRCHLLRDRVANLDQARRRPEGHGCSGSAYECPPQYPCPCRGATVVLRCYGG